MNTREHSDSIIQLHFNLSLINQVSTSVLLKITLQSRIGIEEAATTVN